MIQVKTFKVDYRVEGKRLHGICRWAGNSLQVEMTAPFRGFVTHYHFDYVKMRLTDGNVEGWARHGLKAIYNDIKTVADSEDDYKYLLNRYRSDRFRVIRRQMEFVGAYKDLEMALRLKKISKSEFRMQEWLLLDAFAHVEK